MPCWASACHQREGEGLFFFCFCFLLSKLISFRFKKKKKKEAYLIILLDAVQGRYLSRRESFFGQWLASCSFLRALQVWRIGEEQERGDRPSSTFCRVTPNHDFLLTLSQSCHNKQVQLLIQPNTVCLIFYFNSWLSLKHSSNASHYYSIIKFCRF